MGMILLLCWLGILAGIVMFILGLCAMLNPSERADLALGPIVLCLGLGLVYFCGRGLGWFGLSKESANLERNVTDENQGADTPLESWKCKIAVWKNKQSAALETLQRLENDKRELVARLWKMGVNSSADLRGKPTATVYANELQEVAQQIAATKGKLEDRDEDLVRMESALRRLERLQLLKEVGGTEEEATELAQSIADLDDKLNRASGVKDVGQELKAEAILANELKEVSK